MLWLAGKRRFRCSFLILLILFCLTEKGLKAQVSVDTNFIERFRDQPHLTFEFMRRGQAIELRSPSMPAARIVYHPNTLVNFNVSFDYRWLSLSVGLFRLKANPGRGETSQFSLRASFSGKHIWNSNFIQVYNGFYLANPTLAEPEWTPGSPYPLRPDLTSFTLFSNLDYCFTPQKFSYRAALWQLDRQRKSAGSFILGASYRLHLINSDNSRTLVPDSLFEVFEPRHRLVAQRISNLTFHGGYFHTFVIQKTWFISLYYLPGISIQNGIFLSGDGYTRNFRSKLSGASEFRFIAGFNGDNWFGGISHHSLAFTGNRNIEMWVEDNYSAVRIFAGYRFGAPARKKKNIFRLFKL